MTKPLIDSALTIEEILQQNPKLQCPDEVLEQLTVIEVSYYSFDGQIHTGQLAVHKDLVEDVKGAFTIILEDKFPIQSVIPVADKRFDWDDSISTAANNSSTFNYRYVRNTKDISSHAFGRAIDINPRLNPYFPDGIVFPAHASYDPKTKGAIVEHSRLVQYFDSLGWRWGGNWDEDLDYQHFEKP